MIVNRSFQMIQVIRVRTHFIHFRVKSPSIVNFSRNLQKIDVENFKIFCSKIGKESAKLQKRSKLPLNSLE
jgi:hypothetical protein